MTIDVARLKVENCFKEAAEKYCSNLYVAPDGGLIMPSKAVKTQEKSAVHAYLRRGDYILLVQKEGRDEWELPGGAAEPRESRADAMVRQWKEEITPKIQSEEVREAGKDFALPWTKKEIEATFGEAGKNYTHHVNYVREGMFDKTRKQTFLNLTWEPVLDEHPIAMQNEWQTAEGRAKWFHWSKLPRVDITHWPAIKGWTPELKKASYCKPSPPAVLVR